jgi:hypothetical protein
MSTRVPLWVEVGRLKTMREALCLAQTALLNRLDRPTLPQHQASDTIQALIFEIDQHRPLGPNGKHGNLHTLTCGCEDR